MFRTVPALLLILALIACPYRCGGEISCSSVQATRSCPCCKHRPQGEQASNSGGKQGVPFMPENDCGCDCLCQGAVLTDDEAAQVTPAKCVLPVVPELLSQIFAALDGKSAVAPADSPPHCTCSAGRLMRLANQSLQI